MKITANNTPQILQFDVRGDKDDKLCTTCMWAIVNLDLKNGIMSACTNFGNYTYRWIKTGIEFVKLMAEVDKNYLISKISGKNLFDFDNTVQLIIDCFDDDKEQQEKIIDFFEDFDYCIDEYDFMNAVDERDNDELFDGVDLIAYMSYTYPAQAKTFVKTFIENIQPEIKKYLEAKQRLTEYVEQW